MKARSTSLLAALVITGAVLSSCVYYSNPVPDMPYRPGRRAVVPTPVPTTPAPQAAVPQAPAKVTPPPAAPKKAPVPAATPGRHITQAPAVSYQTPASKPAPVSKPTPPPAQPAAPAKPALISNDGPIPVATRVPGDPLRVFNPLDPSKKIKITDKNGNPQPSGKKLRVPNTNFFFYVP